MVPVTLLQFAYRRGRPVTGTDWYQGAGGATLAGMLIGWLVALIAVAGLIIYMVAANAKVAEVGRIMFFCGLLVTCALLGGHSFRIG